MSHEHFSRNERIQLEGLLKTELTQIIIAQTLSKDASSICREIKKGWTRNRVTGKKGYSWKKAEKVTKQRRNIANQQHRKLGFDADLTSFVRKKLSLDWSPEQI